MRGAALSVADAERIYDVLVEHAGASACMRMAFVHAQADECVTEWRFMGTLGFGGKFWRNVGNRRDGSWGEVWYVTCYSEDETPELWAAINRANDALDAVRSDSESIQ